MSKLVLKRFFIVATIFENIAFVAALFGYLWILLLPFHITRGQEGILDTVYTGVTISIALTWLGGGGSFISFLLIRTNITNSLLSKFRWWLIASLILNLIVTAAFLLTAKAVSVGGPP